LLRQLQATNSAGVIVPIAPRRLSLRAAAPAAYTSRMQWSLSTDASRIQLDVVHAWLETSYWSPGLRRDVCEQAFANSLVAGAYDEGRQLGVARVATDRATFAWLCDVYVDEAARGLGIGRALVGALIAHPELQTIRRWCLGTRDAHDVYRPFGFAAVDPAIMMQYLPDRSRWSS
jgi:GNAT superfamily N-acetyltransferase